MARKLFNKVAIVGVGLIGGSLGMAIKKRRLAKEVVGLARRKAAITDAIRQKAIDKGFLDAGPAIKNADLVVLATPVKTIIDIIPRIKKYLKPGGVVTDVGGCKEKIVNHLEKKLPKGISFVGSHPLAGSEKKGVSFAQSEIFRDSLCVITPTKKTSPVAIKRIRALWNSLGAKVMILNPRTHDKILASISHFPHVLAFNLIQSIPAGYLKFSARGLKDITRIASSDPFLWKDIILMNDRNILKAIDDFQARLTSFKKLIVKKDGRALLNLLKEAKLKRDSL